jgi:hypothetical protein
MNHRGADPDRIPPRDDDTTDRYGQPAVRVLPSELVAEALDASRAQHDRGGGRLPKVVRPERVEHVSDVVRSLRVGEPVVLKLDRLDDAERARAFDVATGIAWALDARITKLEPVGDGIRITPVGLLVSSETGEAAAEPGPEPAPAPEPATAAPATPKAKPARESEAELCALCDLRPVAAHFDSPLEMVLRRDGSRAWAPRIGVCRRCQRSVRHWRFAVAWCAECERWGRRGVVSPCGLAYGS